MEGVKKSNNNTPKKNEFALKIQNIENTYIIKIINIANRIKIEVLKIDNEKKEYSQEYNIDDFHFNHYYFKRFNNINEIYELLVKKLKSKDIFIFQKNGDEIIFKISFHFLKKKEEVQFAIKKTSNISNSFLTLYNNNEEEEESALKIENRNIFKAEKNKKHHLYKKKITIISSVIFIVICCLVIIIIGSKTKPSSSKSLNQNIKYIIFFDNYDNIYINPNDAYPIFDYYRKKGRKEAYYFLLNNSQLYYQLKKENNLNNIIIVDKYKKYRKSFRKKILQFFSNSQLIVYTYRTAYLTKILRSFNYKLKTIYLDHGCTYFKEKFTIEKFTGSRALVKIKPEFDGWIKHGWNSRQLYKGSLARWERFNHIENKRNAILIFFTYRKIRKIDLLSSTFHKKIRNLFSNKNFSNYLISKKIKVFYKKHHQELSLTHGYHENNYGYIYEVTDKDNFSKIIDDSSLLITDYSSLSMDFMFQNKPVIFYLLDINDPNRSFVDKYNTKNITQKMIFGNSFNNSNEVIEKMKYYVENNFTLEDDLQKKYESLFYFKKDILGNLENKLFYILESDNQ